MHAHVRACVCAIVRSRNTSYICGTCHRERRGFIIRKAIDKGPNLRSCDLTIFWWTCVIPKNSTEIKKVGRCYEIGFY